jgi:hypothetical protein
MNQPESPRRLGDFEVVRELGRGGMGVVYEARQVSLNRRVALKVLGGGLGLSGNAVQRFRREAEAAAKLHHTNIVPVYATGEEDGAHFYAMEVIAGPSLDRVLRQLRANQSGQAPVAEPARDLVQTTDLVEDTGIAEEAGLSASPLSSGGAYFDTVARMMAEVADALEHAHRQGVVHRDVKPSNLLLSPAGRLSLNDFGLARMLEQPGMTITGEFVGTPAYTSPEQIASGRIPVDHRTDVYSLGATLYELLTLQPPFTGRQRDQVLAQIVQKEPSPPRKLNKQVPVDLETICLKCLEKDPDRRYQTAGQLADDLRRYVNRFAIAARRAGPVERVHKWMRRHPGLAAGVGLALLALSLAGFFAVQSWRDRQEHLAAVEKASQEKLDEKQKLAAHHILGGDFEMAEEAIREAEALGAAPEWAQWRRSQIAHHQGMHVEAAVLEQAVQRMPTNLAANWLLAIAYRSSHDYDKVEEIASRLNRLPVNEEEEYLYKGITTVIFRSEEGLALLDKAVAERGSLIAFTERASALARFAFEKTDFDRMQQAMDDITAAKRVMRRRDNATVLVESVVVHQLATILYQQNQKTREFEKALRIGDTDARALARFPSIPRAVWIRGIFLAENQQEQEALQWYEEGLKQETVASNVRVRDSYAWLLYERGEADKAFQVIGNVGGTYQDFARAVFVAELPDGLRRARTICDAMPNSMIASLALFLLGEKKAALKLLRDFRPNESHDNGVLFAKLADYMKNPDEATRKSLQEVASRNKGFQIFLHTTLGLRQLAEGDRSGARQHFQKGVAVRQPYWLPNSDWVRAFLVRMQKDPTWPRWIR